MTLQLALTQRFAKNMPNKGYKVVNDSEKHRYELKIKANRFIAPGYGSIEGSFTVDLTFLDLETNQKFQTRGVDAKTLLPFFGMLGVNPDNAVKRALEKIRKYKL